MIPAPAAIDRREAAGVLERIAELLELAGTDGVQVRAFRSAAKAVKGLPDSLEDALENGSLEATRGVGPATLAVVHELVSRGESTLLAELRAATPPGLLEMLRIGGLGVARVRQIHQTLGIDSLPELETAARDGRLAGLSRFGPRLAANVIRGIAQLRSTAALRLLHHADREAEALAAGLSALPGVIAVHIAGDVRRRADLVSALVLVVMTELPPATFFERLRTLPGLDEISGLDERRATLRFQSGRSAEVVATLPPNLGAVLVHATGTEQHLAILRDRAATRGMSLSGGALWEGSRFIPTPEEPTVYALLGLPWIPPECREAEHALAPPAEDQLLESIDLQGVLHCHTHASDGTMSLRELADACSERGYSYVGITDHGATASYAGGLTPEALEHQIADIDDYNAKGGPLRVLRGVEADILQDGSLEYDDVLLKELDFVIASVHNRFGMDRQGMTRRILTALENPYVTILGHPTGRLLLQREPYDLDFEMIVQGAVEHGVALEINADPHRLDLSWRLARAAAARGAMLAIGADAHSVVGLDNVRYGIDVARKAGVPVGQILNALPAEAMVRWGTP